eukprot:COSAG06_NODE_818_length_12113_cov_9.211670_5_plen_340_part_00
MLVRCRVLLALPCAAGAGHRRLHGCCAARRDPLADVLGLAEGSSPPAKPAAGAEASTGPRLLRCTLAPQCRLIIMRSAESSPSRSLAAEKERPLSKRGRRDAPRVAAELQRKGWDPRAVVMSDSVRATETWARMAPALDKAPDSGNVHTSALLACLVEPDASPAAGLRHSSSGADTVRQALLQVDGGGDSGRDSSSLARRPPAPRQRDPLADLLGLGESPASGSDAAAPLPQPGPVLLLGHNPGLEQALVQMIGRDGLDDIVLKSGTAALLEISAASWSEALLHDMHDEQAEPLWRLRGLIVPDELSDDVPGLPPQRFQMSEVQKLKAPKLSKEDNWIR